MSDRQDEFSAEELATCLSHYDLGDIHSIRPFTRGSRRAPKVVIESQRGRFLFKRRPRGRDEPEEVAITHGLQLYLASRDFPVPRLICTRKDNRSMLVHGGAIYELFENVEGHGYGGSPAAACHAGGVLGLCHKLTADYHPQPLPRVGGYHDDEGIRQAIGGTVAALPAECRPAPEILAGVVEDLQAKYTQCAADADEPGLRQWPRQIVHGDWHPGNMLFHDDRVAAVIDWDSIALQPRALELANGALQFSMVGGGDDPGAWPGGLDLAQFRQFLRGYDSANPIDRAELKAVPYLMCEAMIAEAVLPIAATGTFGRLEGFPFLRMIRRKVRWVLQHIERLTLE